MADSGTPRGESVAQQVGEMLRAAREGRGESVTEAALSLKLTQRQVEAMESGRFDLLPGAAFARGFLRNYARHLGLDPAAVMTAVQQPVATASGSVDLAPVSNAEGVMPAGGEGGRRTIVPVVVLIAALVAIMLAGWYFDWFEPATAPEATVEVVPPAGMADGGESEGDPTSAPPLLPPLTAPEGAPPESGAPAESAPADPAPGAVPPEAGGTQGAPQAGAPAAPSSALAPPAAAPAGEPAAPSAGAATAPEATVAAGGGLQFSFDGDSWVEVRDARGRVLHSGLNRAGSTRTVQGEPPFALVVGNAAQVSVQHDGGPVDLAPHIRSNVARLTVK